MASVFSRPDAKHWFAAYRGADGGREKHNTKLLATEANRKKAQRLADQLEQAAEKARSGRLVEEAARTVISEMVEMATGKPLAFETAETWVATWLARKRGAEKAKATLARYEQVTRDFLRHLGPRAKIDLRALHVDDVESFRTAELATGKAPGTVKVAIKALSACFNAACRLRAMDVNIASLEHRDAGHVEKQTFTDKQLAALLRVADAYRGGEWGTLVRLGYYAGGRLTSLANLTWGKIDLDKLTVTLPPVKGQSELVIPLADELARHLRSLTRGAAAAPIMPKLATKKASGEHGLSKTFGALLEAAKIENVTLRTATGDKGRSVRALTFHSLRHTFNSRLANAGVSQELRRELTGHASDAMNDRYTHLELGPKREAIDKLRPIESKP